MRSGEQWRVSREFNRRLKHRFDELGVEIPFPQRTIHIAAEHDGKAAAEPVEELGRRHLLAAGKT